MWFEFQLKLLPKQWDQVIAFEIMKVLRLLAQEVKPGSKQTD